MNYKEKNYIKDSLSSVNIGNSINENSSLQMSTYKKMKTVFKVPNNISSKILSIGNNSQYAAYMILLSGVKYILLQYVIDEKIIMVSPQFSQKQQEDFRKELIRLSNIIDNENTYREYLIGIKNIAINATNEKKKSIVEIYEEMKGVVVLLENIHDKKMLESTTLGTAFLFRVEEQSIVCELEYSLEILKKETVNQIIIDLINFYEIATNHPDIKLSQISSCDRQQKLQIAMTHVFADIKPTNIDLLNENIILLNKGLKDDKHFFFIHDGSGGVESYIQLSSDLDKQYNYWGIKAKNLKNCSPENLTIESIAKTYVKWIKEVVSDAPCNIAGWSNGGPISYEIVRQLEYMGQRIGLFSLIDSQPPIRVKEDEKWEFNIDSETILIQNIINDNLVSHELAQFANVEKMYCFILEYFESNDISCDLILKAVPEEIIEVIPSYKKSHIRELLNSINLVRTIHRAKTLYFPNGKLKTPLHIFRPRQSGIDNIEEWQSYFLAPIQIHDIVGNHFSIFKRPDVIILSSILNELLSIS